MSREPLPPRPEKESFDVSEAPREPFDTDGPERRVADRTVDGTSPLQRALAGLTTAGEWAAQAEADERATAESRERDLGAEPDEVVDLDTAADHGADAEVQQEVAEPSPRERARQRKAEAREARAAQRAEKLARRAARRAAPESPDSEVEASPTVDEVLEAEEQQSRAEGEADSSPDDDAFATSTLPVAEPRLDTRARRTAAKHARRAAALQRRQVRAEAKIRRDGDRDDERGAAPADLADPASAREPDEIDRELAADDVTTELAAVAAAAAAEERLEAERAETVRREAEQLELERLEAERMEAERLIAEELEAERLAAEQAEVERAEAERVEAERLAAAAVVAAPLGDDLTSDEPEVDWEDVERRAAEAAVAVSARAAAREQKASERQRRIEAKAAARLEKDRARRESADADDVPEPPDEARGARGASPLTVVAAIVGAGGLILSVVLAVGAMLAALGTDSGTFYTVVSTLCDALTAPLAGLVDFTGTNAEQKEALVAWGLGSIVYLAIGLGAQSLLRSRTDDD